MRQLLKREQELFSAALALPQLERAGYLARACGGNQDLQLRVSGLLGKVAAAERFSQGHPMIAPEIVQSQPLVRLDDSSSDRIGGYLLQQEIGEGGCAVVYRAEQSTPVRREVAIKILKLGMDTKAVIARFAAERQALAMMDHPNIATVFDAGATAAGRPYFVMELVRGIRVTEYCEYGRLTIAERMELLMQMCRAIQHAHHKGIVHRDIKPSNVLVTVHDGVPTAKVIDFGIAKATRGRLTGETLYTAIEQFIGTPAYVSPEQTEAGPAVDTRSDIYSLGVLLYELLTGYTPFSTDDLTQASFDGMKRRIREEHPPSPSRRLRTLLPQQVEDAAQLRQTSGPRLIKRLEGDLDWIVMRCLEKDPARRYQTCHDLEIDLQRFLRSERVAARPPRLIHTFSRFVRRRRTLVAVIATAISILLLATAVTGWLVLRATRAERLAASEAAARQEVIEFLLGEMVSAAAIYTSVGEHAAAERQLRSAMVAYRRSGAPDWRILAIQSELGACLTRLQRYDEAESLLVEAYAGLVVQADTSAQAAAAGDAGARILDLYSAWGKRDKALQWQRQLAEHFPAVEDRNG